MIDWRRGLHIPHTNTAPGSWGLVCKDEPRPANHDTADRLGVGLGVGLGDGRGGGLGDGLGVGWGVGLGVGCFKFSEHGQLLSLPTFQHWGYNVLLLLAQHIYTLLPRSSVGHFWDIRRTLLGHFATTIRTRLPVRIQLFLVLL
jgi:hypothetical protein